MKFCMPTRDWEAMAAEEQTRFIEIGQAVALGMEEGTAAAVAVF